MFYSSLYAVAAIPMDFHWDTVIVIVMAFILMGSLLLMLKRHMATEKSLKENYDAFVSLAHDICTPLTLIKAPLGELELDTELSDESRKLVKDALRQSERLDMMIRQLLDFKKAENGPERIQWEKCSLTRFLNGKVAEFHLAASQKYIMLEVNVPDGDPYVVTDKEMLSKILDGLLTNAIKYTNSGKVTVTALMESKKWHLIVKDTGIGIPKDEQQFIFHQHYRAKNVANLHIGGSGLGLMMTKMMVHKLGGRIDFKSTEEDGTEFIISFPYASESLITASSGDTETEIDAIKAYIEDAKESDKHQILLVEDDLDTLDYLEKNLSEEFRVIKTSNGNEALTIAQEINPDIVISDVVIPGLAGDELCRILKSSEATSHIPVILLTAMAAREAVVHGLEAGANDYIIKPFDPVVLKARIKNILKMRDSLQKNILNVDSQTDAADYVGQMDREFLNKVKNILADEMSNSQFNVNDLCRRLAVSRTVLYNKTKTLTGESPNDFIRVVRLNKAKELLESHKYMISEVADMVGFSDPKYFSVCYKKQFGVSPSKV